MARSLLLSDTNNPTDGKPNADRNWTECFAQLVGTILSLWDAAALDAAGQDGEVAPTFINLADASIKMVRFPFLRSVPVLMRNRLKLSPQEIKTSSHCRMCCQSRPRERTDIFYTSTQYIRSHSGQLVFGWPCLRTRPCKNYILAP